MCKIRCPLCRKRICDLIAIVEGRTVVRIRCPHCGRTVRLEWLIQTSLNTVTPDDERAWFKMHPQWSKSNKYAELEAWIFI